MQLNTENSPRVVLIGSVNSSRAVLEKMVEHNIDLAGVLALDPTVSQNVSGYNDLGKISEKHGVDYQYFQKVNAPEVIEYVQSKQPDFVFVIGLSQLIKKELLDIPKRGTIGFHPTALPKGRGRGAVAWLLLEKAPAAVSFFLIDEGMDSGDIWIQESFEVKRTDYPQDVIDRIVETIGVVMDKALPDFKRGIINFIPQDDSSATYLGKRNPEDGIIDWKQSAKDIQNHIRVISKPLPGAYTYFKEEKLIIYKSSLFPNSDKYIGVPGRIVEIVENNILIQTGDGVLIIEEFEGAEITDFRVGHTLGINFELEYFKLKEEINKLKQ